MTKTSLKNLGMPAMLIDLVFLAAALFFLLGAAHAAQLKKEATRRGMTIVFYLALMAWIILVFGLKAFVGSETSLAGYFVLGLALLAAGELLATGRRNLAAWSRFAVPAAALALALSFDVFRPDDYSYIPAAILAALVLVATWRVYRRLGKPTKKTNPAPIDWRLIAYILAIAIMLYSALFKMMDRGWSMPWAYLASGGALLFSTSQLWLGWEKILKDKRAADWVRLGAFNLGVLMMAIATVFVYLAFL